MQRLSVRPKRIDYPSTTALTFAKASREERKVNTRDSRSRGYHSCCTCLWPIVVTTRLPRWARRTWRSLWLSRPVAARGQTKPALIDTHVHFLSARISETLA